MKKWIRRFVMTILGLVLGTGMYMICAERVLKDPFPMPFGIGFANVVSGSMEPALKKGTLLLVRKKADAEIGDIVVYQSGESIIVHRIISAEGDQVITKGDANETEDIPIKRSQIKGVVMFKIPEMGYSGCRPLPDTAVQIISRKAQKWLHLNMGNRSCSPLAEQGKQVICSREQTGYTPLQ